MYDEFDRQLMHFPLTLILFHVSNKNSKNVFER